MSKNNDDAVLETERVREVVGVVHDRQQLECLAERLTLAGFNRADIDLLASRDAILQKLHTLYLDPVAAAEAPDMPRRALVTRDDATTTTALVFGTLISIGSLGAALPVLASGGAVAAAVAAAVAGGAGASALAKVIRDRILQKGEEVNIENDLRLGGLVVFVRVRSPEREAAALAIMRECGAQNVHVHEVDIGKHLAEIPLSGTARDPLLDDEKLAT